MQKKTNQEKTKPAAKKGNVQSSIGRIGVLAVGLALCGTGVFFMVTGSLVTERLMAALVLAAGTVIFILSNLSAKLDPLKMLLRNLQYLTQSTEYSARLLRDITEVMKNIEEVEEEERLERKNHKQEMVQEAARVDKDIDQAMQQFDL
jgi:hypothetical protein